jgi:streptogrisin C
MRKRNVLMSVVVTTVAMGAAPAMGAGGSERAGSAGNTELPSDVQVALQRDLGLSAAEAKRHGALQAKAIKLDTQLRAGRGAAFAGSSYDAKSGKLVVRVSESSKLDAARAAGADARLVKRSQADLQAITAELDKAAGRADGTDPAVRRPGGARQASVAGITGWYVDAASNTVRVTVRRSHVQQATAALAKYGDAVTIEAADLDPTPAANYMDGGDLINGSNCSAGINLRNPSTGKGFLLTAGHCVSAGSTLWGQGWFSFGPVLESHYPSYDDAIARNDSAGYWIQGPWVDYNPSNGGVITTSSYTNAPVGTTVCKAGITTKWTCGTISAKNQTVVYDGTKTIYGLTRHTACVEKGDSGGANVSWTGSYRAEGVTSGASLRADSTGRLRCLSAFGQTNVSWYYPIATSLAYYGPRYGVGTW